MAVRFFWSKLSGLFVLLAISLFLALAIEPGVNRLARRGWRRGSATALILFGVLAIFLVVRRRHRHARRLADRRPAAELRDVHHRHRQHDQRHVRHATSTPQEVIDDFNDPDGAVQEFIADQQDNAVRLSVAALGGC